jgi:hypothetical protein
MAKTPNYDINYNDERLTSIQNEGKTAVKDSNKTYDGMIGKSDKFYDKQIAATEAWEKKQTDLQNQKTDFAIEKIEQQKEQTRQDYLKEQSGAYVDWQKQSGQYGVNAEKQAAAGLGGTGFSESSQVSMYNTYQNRVATAREAYGRAVLNYDNAIKDAQLQNSAALAEIAFNSLQKQLELSLQGFQYKNQLLLDKAATQREINNTYYGRYRDEISQINTENAMAENVRQYNERMAEEKRQFNKSYSSSTKPSGDGDGGDGDGGGGGGGGNDPNPVVKPKNDKPKTFSGSTYEAAVSYMEKAGVSSSNASGIKTKHEWSRRKEGYSSYEAYLKDYVEYAVGNLK